MWAIQVSGLSSHGCFGLLSLFWTVWTVERREGKRSWPSDFKITKRIFISNHCHQCSWTGVWVCLNPSMDGRFDFDQQTNWGCAFCWLTQWHLVCPYFVAFSSNICFDQIYQSSSKLAQLFHNHICSTFCVGLSAWLLTKEPIMSIIKLNLHTMRSICLNIQCNHELFQKLNLRIEYISRMSSLH